MYSTDKVRDVFKIVPGEPGAVVCSRVGSQRKVSSGAEGVSREWDVVTTSRKKKRSTTFN